MTRPRYTSADKAPPKRRGPSYFLAFLRSAGVQLTVTADGRLHIHAPLGNVSPLLEQEIRSREAALVELVREGDKVTTSQPVTRHSQPATVTRGDRLIWEGIQGARRAEERRGEVVARARVKGRRAKQMEIDL